MLSFYWGTERILDLFFLQTLKRGNPAPSMPWGTHSQRGSAFVRGSSELSWRQESAPSPNPLLRSKGMATGTNQERGDKTDSRYRNLAKRKEEGWGGASVFQGSTFEESTSFEFGHYAKSRTPPSPPRLGKQLVPPKLLTFV